MKASDCHSKAFINPLALPLHHAMFPGNQFSGDANVSTSCTPQIT